VEYLSGITYSDSNLCSSLSLRELWDPTSEECPNILLTWQRDGIAIVDKWSTAFDAFIRTRGDNITENERKGVAVLRLLKDYASTSIMIARTMDDDQRNWDVFIPIFEKIVCRAEELVNLDFKNNEGKPTFGVDMAFVGPLFEVSCRCRDPLIRRRAISTLRTCGRTEGLWNAFLASKVAQKVMEIEEAGLAQVQRCEDIPDWARISDISPVFDPVGRKATLTYSRPSSGCGVSRATVVEVIEW
jgi:hypothetical protein